jgi:hypothetical protein
MICWSGEVLLVACFSFRKWRPKISGHGRFPRMPSAYRMSHSTVERGTSALVLLLTSRY